MDLRVPKLNPPQSQRPKNRPSKILFTNKDYDKWEKDSFETLLPEEEKAKQKWTLLLFITPVFWPDRFFPKKVAPDRLIFQISIPIFIPAWTSSD